ncbi:MAG TPA: DUF4115 domain-containing protein [Chromatiales bacterium]|nr:DUF4115 domain-containing protein [Chromatiales bacterium]
MPDRPDKPESRDPAADGTGTGGAGDRLREARESKKLAVEQVAESLHLDEHLVVAIEQENFDALGAPVFVRGHIRTYARLLELPADELLEACGLLADEPENSVEPALATAGRSPVVTINPGPWAIGALGLLLAAGLVYYVFQEPAPSTVKLPPSVHQVTQVPSPSEAVLSVPAPVKPESSGQIGTAEVMEKPADQPLPVVPAAEPVADKSEEKDEPAGAPAADPAHTLELYFHGESWAEVSDRDHRILFGLQHEGVRRELHGHPPFRLLLGNARQVDILVDGKPYPLPEGSVRGKVARLSIDPVTVASRQ